MPETFLIDGIKMAAYTPRRHMKPIGALYALFERLSGIVARLLRWSPIGRDVVVIIESSDDARLTGARLHGTVRAWADEPGTSAFLIHLRNVVQYHGAFVAEEIDVVVARSAVRRHGKNRLLIAWIAVLLIDAPSFVDQTYSRAIGTGRLELV